MVWTYAFQPELGLINELLRTLHLPTSLWLGSSQVALPALVLVTIWQRFGWFMILFLAGLQGVSQTLVEAARIDGAGRWSIFRHVTLPALRTTLTVVLILEIISSLKVFDIVYGLTGGGPAQATQMLALWAFTQSMQIFDFGRGAAISVMLLTITIAIVIPYLRWSQRHEETE